MTDPQRLILVRALHTAIYVIMATAVFLVLYAGVTGATGPGYGRRWDWSRSRSLSSPAAA